MERNFYVAIIYIVRLVTDEFLGTTVKVCLNRSRLNQFHVDIERCQLELERFDESFNRPF